MTVCCSLVHFSDASSFCLSGFLQSCDLAPVLWSSVTGQCLGLCLTAVGSSTAVSSGLGACGRLSAVGAVSPSTFLSLLWVGPVIALFSGVTWAWQPPENAFRYSHSLTVSVVFPVPLYLTHTRTHAYIGVCVYTYSTLITDSLVFTEVCWSYII